ncbi:hypothetical protein MHYP_G00034080 [Metynnis hypsauchen]
MTFDLKNLLNTDLPSVNDAVDFYNKTLSSILDLHAPVKTRTVTFSRPAPWFTDELTEMKAARRALERCYKASGLTVHKLAYWEHQKDYSRSITEAQSQFYGNIIKNSQGNSKQLFTTVNHLLKPQAPLLTESTEEHCNNFMTFIRTKTHSIRSAISTFSTLHVQGTYSQTEVSQPLNCFPEVSQQEVEGIVRKMKPSTCALDPFHTSLVKANISSDLHESGRPSLCQWICPIKIRGAPILADIP